GGIAKVGSSAPSLMPSATSSASRSPIGRSRGNSSGAPVPPSSPDRRRKASRKARVARRVGSNTVMRASRSGSPAAMPSSPRASVAKNGWSGAIVKMFCGKTGLLVFSTRRHEEHEEDQSTSVFFVSSWLISPLDAMRGKADAGRGKAFRRADMVPLAVMHDRVQPAGLQRPSVKTRQGKPLFADAAEQPPVQQLNAGENVGRDLPLAAPPGRAERIEKEIA